MRETRLQRHRRRTAWIAMAIVLALGVGACGSDDDGGDEAKSGDATAARSGGEISGTPEEQEVAQVYARFLQAVARGDAVTVCNAMTRRSRSFISPDKGVSCVKLFKQPNRPKVDLKAITGAEVHGDEAIVFHDTAPPKPPNKVRFVRQEGEWKLDAPSFTSPGG
jgi:hypothetical protein